MTGDQFGATHSKRPEAGAPICSTPHCTTVWRCYSPFTATVDMPKEVNLELIFM